MGCLPVVRMDPRIIGPPAAPRNARERARWRERAPAAGERPHHQGAPAMPQASVIDPSVTVIRFAGRATVAGPPVGSPVAGSKVDR